MYPFAPLKMIQAHMKEIVELEVSPKARKAGQFLQQYRTHGQNLPFIWLLRRTAFINRALAAYKLNPTKRLKLALLCYAYKV
jgi:hypothetical protein